MKASLGGYYGLAPKERRLQDDKLVRLLRTRGLNDQQINNIVASEQADPEHHSIRKICQINGLPKYPIQRASSPVSPPQKRDPFKIQNKIALKTFLANTGDKAHHKCLAKNVFKELVVKDHQKVLAKKIVNEIPKAHHKVLAKKIVNEIVDKSHHKVLAKKIVNKAIPILKLIGVRPSDVVAVSEAIVAHAPAVAQELALTTEDQSPSRKKVNLKIKPLTKEVKASRRTLVANLTPEEHEKRKKYERERKANFRAKQ